MSEEKKESKNCSSKKRIMFSYGFIQLGSSLVSAVALAAIAFGFCSVKRESKVFIILTSFKADIIVSFRVVVVSYEKSIV